MNWPTVKECFTFDCEKKKRGEKRPFYSAGSSGKSFLVFISETLLVNGVPVNVSFPNFIKLSLGCVEFSRKRRKSPRLLVLSYRAIKLNCRAQEASVSSDKSLPQFHSNTVVG